MNMTGRKTMQAVAKTRQINIRFKTWILAQVFYSKKQYLDFIDDDDELVDSTTTDWYK